MAIPEHDKCVRMWKNIRRIKKKRFWIETRRLRRKDGKIYRKQRFRNMLKAENLISKYVILRNGYSSIHELGVEVHGKHYRRWGKYDD